MVRSELLTFMGCDVPVAHAKAARLKSQPVSPASRLHTVRFEAGCGGVP
jgi:hypothetical protein